MPGTNNPLNELGLQKQLLIAESEVNRAMLIEEGKVIMAELKPIAQTVRRLGGFASSAVAGVAAFASPEAGSNGSSVEKSSWPQVIFGGLRLGLSVWSALRKSKDE